MWLESNIASSMEFGVKAKRGISNVIWITFHSAVNSECEAQRSLHEALVSTNARRPLCSLCTPDSAGLRLPPRPPPQPPARRLERLATPDLPNTDEWAFCGCMAETHIVKSGTVVRRRGCWREHIGDTAALCLFTFLLGHRLHLSQVFSRTSVE